ncbi:hypothetical protein [Methylocystis echinoides]|uniref:Uncharacterized protein n=1 Tax=Methylocystis echinoides TaxID=29468 RepID=A0A9W6GSM3_9HYPH|nr:hypothetical protein [Methylocystis echinoides]GLI92155.1 hypothetical protein LMG27198_11470 [Methylocystis echinoides]
MKSNRYCERSDAIQSHITAPGLLRRARNDGIGLLVALLLATPAEAGPRSIDDCESIKDANAYNLCLASFGPMRGQHGATYPGAASEGEKHGRSASGPGRRPPPRLAAPPLPRGARVSHGGNGRIRMEFTP